MSHRGEGFVYTDKPSPAKKMPGPPGSGPSKPPIDKVLVRKELSDSDAEAPSTSKEASASGTTGATPPERAHDQVSGLPDASTLVASVPPPPPPLPESGNVGGMESGSQSQLAQKLADA